MQHFAKIFQNFFLQNFKNFSTGAVSHFALCSGTTVFFCDNGKAIPKAFTCDYENDCTHGEDESPEVCL